MIVSFIPSEVIVSVNSAMIVVIVYLARQLAKLSERVARLEGRLNGRRGRADQG